MAIIAELRAVLGRLQHRIAELKGHFVGLLLGVSMADVGD